MSTDGLDTPFPDGTTSDNPPAEAPADSAVSAEPSSTELSSTEPSTTGAPLTDDPATQGPATAAVGPDGPRVDDDRAEVDPEREGDVAADYLEELLDIADLDGDIDLDVEGDRAVVSLVGGDLQVLVGPQGTVLEALQDLTRLAVLRSTGHRSRLLLDVDGYRARRRDQIRVRATEAVEAARSSGEPFAMPPMSAYERKVVHDVVAELGLVSASDGEEPNRHVVVRTS
jgi:spoIIIJ-associated protein